MSRLSSSPRAAALTDALLRIVSERGLDHVSVREVAAEGGVSIGTVQHYFPTKDEMLAAAFNEVVRRVRARIAALDLRGDLRRNLSAVLRELLPLDDMRAAEARIMIAFAARAATSPPLADIQRTILTELQDALADAFASGAGEDASPARSRTAARVALAATDGLALHAVTAPGLMPTRQLTAAVEFLLDALLPDDVKPPRRRAADE